jgi:protein-disulfide isomerase
LSRNQLLIAFAAVILVAVIGAAAWFFRAANQAPNGTPAPGNPGFTILASDRTLGKRDAKVVLIEYGAPSCPVCAEFNADTFPQLKKNYIDTGKVFYVFRVFPIREDDGTAEKIARCLPEDKYFSFIDLLFRNQPLWDVENGVLDVHGGLVHVGQMAGLSPQQVDKCIDNKQEDNRINKVAADGDARYTITGTPTIVVNGMPQPAGAIPYADLSKILDAQLAK